MKRCLSLLMILLLLALFPVMALAEQTGEVSFPYVLDNAGILTESQRSSLETRAAELSEEHGCKLYIVTVKDHSEFNPDVYEAAKGIYNFYDLGYGEGKDGVLLLLSMNERDYSFVGHGDKGETICGYESSWLVEDEFLDDFRRDDWYGGFSDYLEACGRQLTKLESGEDITEGADIIVGPNGQEYHSYNAPGEPTRMPTGAKLAIGLGAPCLIALGVCATFKAQMNMWYPAAPLCVSGTITSSTAPRLASPSTRRAPPDGAAAPAEAASIPAAASPAAAGNSEKAKSRPPGGFLQRSTL